MGLQQPLSNPISAPSSNPGLGALPPLPPPSSLVPNTPVNNPNQATTPPTTNGMSSPLSDLPPPHVAAPRVYYQTPKTPPAPLPVISPPAMPSASPTQQGNPAPPVQPQQQAPPAPQTPPGPTAPLPVSGLDDKTITDLNSRLNNQSDGVRSDAATDFLKILQKSPDLSDNPQYKPYVDAFLEKILNDPSTIVRQAGLLALETGCLKQPSQAIKDRLTALSQKGGMYNLEADSAKNALSKIASSQAAPAAGQKLDITSAASGSTAPVQNQTAPQVGQRLNIQEGPAL